MIDGKAEKTWFLYILETSTGTLYTGITTDVQRRMNEHANSKKGAKALRGRAPFTLRFQAALFSHSDALKAESWVKAQTPQSKRRIISRDLSLPIRCKVICINE